MHDDRSNINVHDLTLMATTIARSLYALATVDDVKDATAMNQIYPKHVYFCLWIAVEHLCGVRLGLNVRMCECANVRMFECSNI